MNQPNFPYSHPLQLDLSENNRIFFRFSLEFFWLEEKIMNNSRIRNIRFDEDAPHPLAREIDKGGDFPVGPCYLDIQMKKRGGMGGISFL